MKKEIFIVETGTLLPKNDDEFEYYAIDFNGKKFALYDEDYIVFLDLKEAQNYIRDWSEYNSYCIIHSSIENLTNEQIESIQEDSDYGTFINPSCESTLYFAYKYQSNIIVEINKIKEEL